MDKVIATPGGTNEIIRKYNLKLHKGLGQNFLIDQNIVDKIINTADLNNEDIVIEIGPGIGSLTQKIVPRSGRVFAFEKDKRLVKVLRELFNGYNHLEVIGQDVLEVDWKHFFDSRGISDRSVKVLANLPYYITTPVIMGLLESNITFSLMVLMVQKEVADRMAAAPGSKDYGALSVAVQYYGEVEIFHKVPPTVFIPRPRVYSSIIKIKPHSEPVYRVKNEGFFFKMVRAIFQQRRKTLKNSLTKSSEIKLDKGIVTEAIRELGLDPRIRGEKLTIKQMAILSNTLWYKISEEDGENHEIY